MWGASESSDGQLPDGWGAFNYFLQSNVSQIAPRRHCPALWSSNGVLPTTAKPLTLSQSHNLIK